MFEWCVVYVWIYERTPTKRHHVFYGDWSTCSKYVDCSGLNSHQHNWGTYVTT